MSSSTIAAAISSFFIPPNPGSVPLWFGDTIAGVASVQADEIWRAQVDLISPSANLPDDPGIIFLGTDDSFVTIVKVEGGVGLAAAGAVAAQATQRAVVKGRRGVSGRSQAGPNFGASPPPGAGPGWGGIGV
jgi:hypothetical protein